MKRFLALPPPIAFRLGLLPPASHAAYHTAMDDFPTRYGPHALVLGGTEGIGLAFSEAAARRGVAPIVVGRDADDPAAIATRIARSHGVSAVGIGADLAVEGAIDDVVAACGDRDIGLVVYVAALSQPGPFEGLDRKAKLRALTLNCRGPLETCDIFLPRLTRRRRGGLILLSSASAFQGTGWVATYATTKAFNTVLGEGLWFEYRDRGVDVLAVEPGLTDTPTLRATGAKTGPLAFFAPVQSPEEVAEEAFGALGRRPSHVCGGRGRALTLALRRALPRRALVQLYGKSTRDLYR